MASKPLRIKLIAQLNSDVPRLTQATSTTAPRALRGMLAKELIKREASGETATMYPEIATKAICMVNGISVQYPSPNPRATCTKGTPMDIAANVTTMTASAAKM
ncbi:hypothetical protein D3C80_1845170 [compost metagenome]